METFTITDHRDAADVQLSYWPATKRVQITDPRAGYFDPNDPLEAQAQEFAYIRAPIVSNSPHETGRTHLNQFCEKFCGAACLFYMADLKRSTDTQPNQT